MTRRKIWRDMLRGGVLGIALVLPAGCSVLPNGGPMVSDFNDTVKSRKDIRFVLQDVDQHTLSVLDSYNAIDGVRALDEDRPAMLTLGPGDGLQLAIYQFGAAGAFTQSQVALGQVPGTSGGSGAGMGGQAPKAQISGLTIDEDGYITVPYAGRLRVGGLTVADAQKLIESRLRNVLTDPEVSLTVAANASNLVTVMGAIRMPGRYSITSAKETFLEIVAAAGGPVGPPHDMWFDITRHGHQVSIPMDKFLKSPATNIHVDKGDLINAVIRPQVYQVFGAAKLPAEYPIGDNGQTVAQGLAHGGGLLDQQADTRGVYLLRYEAPKVVELLKQSGKEAKKSNALRIDPVSGRVPVVYAFDVGKPSGYFMAMHFQIESGDLLFISDARLVQWLKVLSLLGTLTQAGSRGASLGGGF